MPTEQEQARNLMSKLYWSTMRNSKLYLNPSVLRQMYRQYLRWRQLVKSRKDWWNSKKERAKIYEFDRCLVHYLLERCFWVSYGDSDVVADLLSILYEVDGHLGKIFYGRSTPVRTWHWKKKESKDSDEVVQKIYPLNSTWNTALLHQVNKQPIDYFIKHAYKKKMLFDDQRLAEQCLLRHKIQNAYGSTDMLFHPPCSMFFTAPGILKSLLQHGLFAKSDADDENVGRLLTGIIGVWASGATFKISHATSTISERSTSIVPEDFSPGDTQTVLERYTSTVPEHSPSIVIEDSTPINSEKSTETIPENSSSKVLEVGDMLLRAVRSVDINVLLAFQGVRNRRVGIPRIVDKVSTDDFLPMLKTRCSGPQDLQHLCRCQIRRQLYDCWQLPDGIGFLPLPKTVKQYLRLERD